MTLQEFIDKHGLPPPFNHLDALQEALELKKEFFPEWYADVKKCHEDPFAHYNLFAYLYPHLIPELEIVL